MCAWGEFRLSREPIVGGSGQRLGRIDDPVRRSDIGRRVDRIQKALGRKTPDDPTR